MLLRRLLVVADSGEVVRGSSSVAYVTAVSLTQAGTLLIIVSDSTASMSSRCQTATIRAPDARLLVIPPNAQTLSAR